MYRSFHLESFEEEARRILSLAHAKAREILAAAVEESKGIRERAKREGFEEGRAEGREEARTQERERLARETSGVLPLLETAARGIAEKRAEVKGEAEREVLRLSVAIAERIVKAETATAGKIAAGNVEEAIRLAVDRRHLVVWVHPADRAAVEEFLPQVSVRLGAGDSVLLREDASISRGGCRVTAEAATIDADLRTQLEEIERALLG